MRDQEARGRLVHALRQAGITANPQKVADAICTLMNQKIARSEGKHHARFHKTAAPVPENGKPYTPFSEGPHEG
jgi:hypothetical protein